MLQNIQYITGDVRTEKARTVKVSSFDHRAMRWLPHLVMAVVVACLASCSDDSESDKAPQPKPNTATNFMLQPCAFSYVEEWPVKSGATRSSWTPPEGYVSYSRIDLQKDLIKNTIVVFFTRDGKPTFSNCFNYYVPEDLEADPYWIPDLQDDEELKVESGRPYQLYGYIPYEAADEITVSTDLSTLIRGYDNGAPNDSYSEGAVLTLKGLDSVTASDVCVVVGVKDGKSLVEDNGLVRGLFNFSAQGSGGANHYVFLLFDHIYAAIQFRFTVGADYDYLRTIRIRRVELKAKGSGIAASYNAKVTLKKNETKASPIEDIVFTKNGESNPDYVRLYDWGVKEGDTDYSDRVNTLSKEKDVILENGAYSSFMGCFMPGESTIESKEFVLRTTYDVFDKKGNLIREKCQAENNMLLIKDGEREGLFDDESLLRGHRYSINLSVEPTYLYVLSEPDVDNPTLIIE